MDYCTVKTEGGGLKMEDFTRPCDLSTLNMHIYGRLEIIACNFALVDNLQIFAHKKHFLVSSRQERG